MRFVFLMAVLQLIYPAAAQLNVELYGAHVNYIEKSVLTRRFKHDDVTAIISKLGKDFRVKQVGTSVEGRSINLISYGNGPLDVLMWSQMHGDETTATRAILDIFRFLQTDDAFNGLRAQLKSSITWHFIPMLNPDGASRFTRRNHNGIDINRDAMQLQTPEGRTLKRVRDSLKADWGFNLHDQGRGTSVNGLPATISLLAPPFNKAREINKTRGDAMQLARYLHDQITPFIPGQIGIYPDAFEPRAFGDNIQKWGTRTILIESGGYKDDWEKQEIRKLNFVLLLTAAVAITENAFEKVPVEAYSKIPGNAGTRLQELILFNVSFEGLRRDVAFDRSEIDNEDYRKYYAQSFISDMGDLSTSMAHTTFDAAGFTVTRGSFYQTEFDNISQLQEMDIQKLLQEGYTDFVVHHGFDPFTHGFQIRVHSQAPSEGLELRMGDNPSLLFKKDGAVKFVLINGTLLAVK